MLDLWQVLIKCPFPTPFFVAQNPWRFLLSQPLCLGMRRAVETNQSVGASCVVEKDPQFSFKVTSSQPSSLPRTPGVKAGLWGVG